MQDKIVGLFYKSYIHAYTVMFLHISVIVGFINHVDLNISSPFSFQNFNNFLNFLNICHYFYWKTSKIVTTSSVHY